jgi:hypothetical protein
MNPVRINLGAGALYPDHPTFSRSQPPRDSNSPSSSSPPLMMRKPVSPFLRVICKPYADESLCLGKIKILSLTTNFH